MPRAFIWMLRRGFAAPIILRHCRSSLALRGATTCSASGIAAPASARRNHESSHRSAWFSKAVSGISWRRAAISFARIARRTSPTPSFATRPSRGRRTSILRPIGRRPRTTTKPGSIAGTRTCGSHPEACRCWHCSDPTCAIGPSRPAAKPDRRGWVRCRMPIENIDYGVRELLRLGNEVTVVGPADVRKAVSETAHALAQHHGTKARPNQPRS